MVIKGYAVGPLLRKTWSEINDDNVPIYAGHMAYNFFFAMFPLMLFFAALLSLIATPQQVLGWMNGMVGYLPPAAASLLSATLVKIMLGHGAPGLLSFGLIVAAWSGSAVFGAFMGALNDAYDVVETRPWWKQQLIKLAALAGAGTVIVFSTIVLVNGEAIVGWIGGHIGLGTVATLLWKIIQFPVAIAAVVLVVGLLYYFLPNTKSQNKRIVLFGATIATALWFAATMLFRLYVKVFHTLNPAYGAIGSVMVLLTWMYYSSFVMLAVGELNSELEAGTANEGLSRDKARLHVQERVQGARKTKRAQAGR